MNQPCKDVGRKHSRRGNKQHLRGLRVEAKGRLKEQKAEADQNCRSIVGKEERPWRGRP